MNIPPQPAAAEVLAYQRYRKSQDKKEWRRENRRIRKQLQEKSKAEAQRARRRSATFVEGNLQAALSAAFVPSAPSLRKKTPA